MTPCAYTWPGFVTAVAVACVFGIVVGYLWATHSRVTAAQPAEKARAA